MNDIPKDAVSRLVAYADYRALPISQRSVSALFDLYVERHRSGEDVPTTHRNTLFSWAKDDDWRGRLLKDETERLEAEAKDMSIFRRRALFRLSTVFDEAIQEWHRLIMDNLVDANVKARLIVELADRVGFPKESRIATSRRGDGDGPQPPTPVPGADATEVELTAYYARTGGQG